MKWMLIVALGAAGPAVSGCRTASVKSDTPGLYSGPAYDFRYLGLYGAVGLPTTLTPVADCRGGKWSARAELATGSLPPGLRLNSDNTITGVPTLAGDWYFSVRYTAVTCAGKNYKDVSENVNVKIAGSSAPR